MQASNQNESEYNITYDPNVALEFFKVFGKSESAKHGEVIFTQGDKANPFLLQRDKMYLLVQGTVHIQVGTEIIASVTAGDIFGELTPLILSVRSATAIADEPCRLMAISEKQLRAGLKERPEFALMLMSLFVRYLRHAVTETKGVATVNEIKSSKKNSVFSTKTIRELVKKLGDEAVISVPKRRVIFQEGASGMLMYVIIDGYVSASIGDKVVERTGPGGVIGEIALIDQRRRIAKVVAQTNCMLLGFNRDMFLAQVKAEPSFGIAVLRALASRLYLCRTGRPYTPPPPSLFDGF